MEKISTIDFYDQNAKNWGKQFNLWSRGICYEHFYLPKLQAWNVFPNNSTATEIGCGMGHKLNKTKKLLEKNVDLYGIEASKELINQAKQKHPALSGLITKDNAFLLDSVEDESQDVLMYYQIIHHFNGEETERAIKIAKQKLKPNGRIVIIDTFNMDNHPIRKQWFQVIEPIYALLAARSFDGLGEYHNQPKDNFIAFMGAMGFSLIHETGDKWPYIISEMLVFELN